MSNEVRSEMSAREGWHARKIREELAALQHHDSVQITSVLKRLEHAKLLDLPRPGCGETAARFAALSEIAAHDLSLARLAEGHADALAILAELGAAPQPGLYGVWAADSATSAVQAQSAGRSYRLQGIKRYASGATTLARALVTAHTTAGVQLFDISLSTPGIKPLPGTWAAVGMSDSDSLDVSFDAVEVSESAAVGGSGAYLERAGFWHGGVGVAACWFGGALGCARMLRERLERSSPDLHAVAHLGSVAIACHSMQTVLASAARAIDLDPADHRAARERALLVRGVVEHGCEEVLHHTGRASGSSPLVFDRRHARRAADLPVYVRQHHAERDLAELGAIAMRGRS